MGGDATTTGPNRAADRHRDRQRDRQRDRGGRGRAARLAVVALLTALVGLAALPVTAPAGAAEPGQDCPCSLWSADDVPDIVDFDDPLPVELGVHFTVDIEAPITGLRYYKSAANAGTHVGSLWSLDGTLLARATFVGETESGWQQVSFTPPVLAVPGQIYVASYHTPSGHYSVTPAYFLHTSRDNGVLHAPAGTPDVPNGIFAYSPEPTFPTGTWNDNNYWIDVVVGPLLSSLAVTPAASTLITGDTVALTATGAYLNGTTADLTGTVGWTSSNPAVATVSPTGVVTTTGRGTVTITATSGAVTASATVTVRDVTGVAVTGVPTSLAKGLSATARATATLSDGSAVDVTSSLVSSNPAVASVTSAGVLKGAAVGAATLSATYRGVTGSAAITVTPAQLVSLSTTPGAVTLRWLTAVQLKAVATYTDGATVDVTSSATWSTSNLLGAVVCGGRVTALIWLGDVRITATYGGRTAVATVTVRV